jgi:hypothetical protein
MADCIIATYMDYDEHYGSVIITPGNVACASSGSLRLLAEVSEDSARRSMGEAFDPKLVDWHWLGLLADTSSVHVLELLGAPVA